MPDQEPPAPRRRPGSVLYGRQPLVINTDIAVALGVNAAIIVQQISYWMDRTNNVRDGRKWVWNTYAKWQSQFPFLSEKTVKRTFLELEKRGILLSTKLKLDAWDQTKAYTIEYDRLDEACAAVTSSADQPDRDDQSAQDGPDEPSGPGPIERPNLGRSPTRAETTPETTAAEPAIAAAAGATLGKTWTPADPDDEPFALEQSDLFPSPPTHTTPTPAPFTMADPTAPPPRPVPVDAGTDIAMSAAFLRGAGVAVEVADRLAVQHTMERVRGAIAKAQRKAVRDKATNVPGYIVATLQNGGPIALPDGVRNRDYGGAAERSDHREACDRDSAKRAAERSAAEAGQQTDRQYLDAYADRNGPAALEGVAAQVKAEILTGRDVAGVKASDFTAKRLMTAAGWSGNRLWESLMVGWLKQQKGGI